MLLVRLSKPVDVLGRRQELTWISMTAAAAVASGDGESGETAGCRIAFVSNFAAPKEMRGGALSAGPIPPPVCSLPLNHCGTSCVEAADGFALSGRRLMRPLLPPSPPWEGDRNRVGVDRG